MTAQAPIIQVDGLIKRFAEFTAVDRLSFSVNRGEIFGLVGPDGAGKTATMRMLAGVMRPNGGAIVIDGIDAVADPEEAKQHVSYSPLGRGILASGALPESQRMLTDYRRKDLRFGSERLAFLTDRLAPLWQIAASRAVAPATVALAWLLSKAPTIRVIPGAKSEAQLIAALQAGAFVLTNEELASLDLIVDVR